MKHNTIKRIISLMIIFVFSLNCLTAFASDNTNEKRIVKVGYFPFAYMQEFDEEGNYIGHTYDYLQEILPYTNWEYKFVECTAIEALSMIQTGEIDILGCLIKSEEREKLANFTDFYSGYNMTKLLTRASEERFPAFSYTDYDGMTIGVQPHSVNAEQLREFAQRNDFTYIERYYENDADMYAALEKGEVDAICHSALKPEEWTRVLAYFDMTPFYFVVTKENTELLQEFNYAIGQKKADEPSFEEKLRQRHIADYSDKTIVFSDAEKEYLSSSPKVKVGIDGYFMPIEGFDSEDNQPIGYTIEVLNKISEITGIEFEIVSGDTYLETTNMLLNNEIDVLSSVNISIMDILDNKTSMAYLEASIVLLGKNDFFPQADDEVIIAIPPKTTKLEEQIRKRYPSATFIYFDSTRKALSSIAKGETHLIARNVYAAQSDIATDYKDFRIIHDLKMNTQLRFAFSSSTAPALQSIFDKCIASLSGSDKSSMMLSATMSQVDTTDQTARTIMAIFIAALALALAFWLFVRLRKARKRLVNIAYFDELTGLPNLVKFKKDAKELLEKYPQGELSVLMIDIADFSYVNEYHGFEFGNLVLQNFANIVSAVNNEYTLLARVASDTFVVLTKMDKDSDNSLIYADKLNRFKSNHKDIKLSYYVGRYDIPANENDIEAIYEKVNYVHSYAKKNNRKNVIVDYDENTKKIAAKNREIESKMEYALENEEFKVFLQPKFNCSGTKIVGAEALVRWTEAKTNSVIFPDDFIPLFEQNGFILKLDLYMFEQTCIMLSQWKEKNIPLIPISVNFSRLHFSNNNFAKTLHEISQKYNVEPSYLEIEITENALSTVYDEIKQTITKLHQYGFKVSMDDFSSQHSSMAFLSEIMVDVVKLDRSFITSVTENNRSRILVEGTIHMLKKMGVTIVAEGVETVEQLDVLSNAQCDIIQGYVFSKPLPLQELEKLIKN